MKRDILENIIRPETKEPLRYLLSNKDTQIDGDLVVKNIARYTLTSSSTDNTHKDDLVILTIYNKKTGKHFKVRLDEWMFKSYEMHGYNTFESTLQYLGEESHTKFYTLLKKINNIREIYNIPNHLSNVYDMLYFLTNRKIKTSSNFNLVYIGDYENEMSYNRFVFSPSIRLSSLLRWINNIEFLLICDYSQQCEINVRYKRALTNVIDRLYFEGYTVDYDVEEAVKLLIIEKYIKRLMEVDHIKDSDRYKYEYLKNSELKKIMEYIKYKQNECISNSENNKDVIAIFEDENFINTNEIEFIINEDVEVEELETIASDEEKVEWKNSCVQVHSVMTLYKPELDKDIVTENTKEETDINTRVSSLEDCVSDLVKSISDLTKTVNEVKSYTVKVGGNNE